LKGLSDEELVKYLITFSMQLAFVEELKNGTDMEDVVELSCNGKKLKQNDEETLIRLSRNSTICHKYINLLKLELQKKSVTPLEFKNLYEKLIEEWEMINVHY